MSKVTLRDIAQVNPTTTFDHLDASRDIAFIPMADVSESGQWVSHQTKHRSEASLGFTRFRENDVLFAKITPCMENGKGALLERLPGGHGFGSTEFHVIRPKPGHDPYFVYSVLQDRDLRQRARNWMTGSAGQQRVPPSSLEAIPIHVTDKDHQRAIGETLRIVDLLIAETQRVIAKQERVRAGLLQALLTRGIDENGEIRDEPPAIAHHCSEASSPRFWIERPLKRLTAKIADRDHTTPTYVEHGVLMVSPTHFVEYDQIEFGKCPCITAVAHGINRRKTDVQPGDIIFHRIGAGLGKVRFVNESMPDFSILHSLCLVRPDPEVVDPKFLYWAFRSYAVQLQISLEVQSIGVPDLGLKKIEEFVFRVPASLEEQKTIRKALDRVQHEASERARQLDKLKRLKTGLTRDLLSGRVSVETLLDLPSLASEKMEKR